jgi:hypothetical protein
MFEIYDSNNKIPENRYLEMNDILLKDYILRKGLEEYKKREKVFKGEGFEYWKSMILNDPNYNIILYILDKKIVAFICYILMKDSVCLAEIQIIKEYQVKNDIFRKILNKFLEEIKNKKYKIISATIDKDNQKSRAVFSHIGMINTKDNWFETSIETLEKWLNKSGS